MTIEKPIVRFTLHIFRDVKELCDKSNSKDFELDLTSYNENKKNKDVLRFNGDDDDWEAQKQSMNSINKSDQGACQQGKRPLAEKQQAAKPKSSKRPHAEDNSGKKNLSTVNEISTPKRPKEKQGCSQQQDTSLDSDPSDSPVAKKQRKIPEQTVQPQESSISNVEMPSNNQPASPSTNNQIDSEELDPSTTTAHPGFRNPGYMCYMNATLQALYASDKFCQYLAGLDLNPQEKPNQKTLAAVSYLSMFINQDESLDGSIDIDVVVSFIGKSLAQRRLNFDPDIQQDAHEFVVKMLAVLQSDIRKYVYETIDICKDLFLLHSSYLPSFCSSCGKNVSPSILQEHLIYYIDMLESKEGESIQELIDKNLVAEFEQRCCQNDIKCLSQINDLSLILLVGLKRYTQTGNKICTPLEISTELVLAKFKRNNAAEGSEGDSDDDDQTDENPHTDHVYRLIGIVNHIGPTMTKGHYVAYVHDTIEEAWVLCNDEQTKKVDLSMALCDSVETCYLLVYEAVELKDMTNSREMNTDCDSNANEKDTADNHIETNSSDSENEVSSSV